MDTVSANESAARTPSSHPPEPLHFTGTGAGYFGIWIVNLLLTIVTLGIYSPWAKVRRLKYFYRNTELAGSTFDFHGSPVRILIGRVIAIVMLFIYNYSARVPSRLTLVVLVLLAIVMPWLLRNSFRFRLYNTSWRGTRFHFRGSVASAYRVFLLNGFLTLITLYLLAPFMHQRLKAYQHDNTWFGRTRCSFHAGAGRFYAIYLLVLLGMVALGCVIAFSGAGTTLVALAQAGKHGGRVDPAAAARFAVILYGSLIVLGVSVGPVFHALIGNLIWSNTRIGEHRIECNMSPWKLIWITASNFVLVICTLGLFIPWAWVRLAKFQLEAVRLLPASDLQEFEAAEPESPDAIGEEAASVFDFDISL